MVNLFLYAIVILTFFAPGVPLVRGLPTIHIEDILLVLVVILGGKLSHNLFFGQHLKKLTLPLIVLVTYVFVVTVIMAAVLPTFQSLSFSVFLALGRYKAPILAAVMFALLREPRQLSRVGGLLMIMAVAEFVLTLMQQTNILGVNAWLSPLYRATMQIEVGASVNRLFGSVSNANDLGTILSVLGTLAYARFALGPGVKARVFAGLTAALALTCCVALAGTRQGTACLLVGIFFVQVIVLLKSRRYGLSFVVTILLVLLLAVGFYYLQSNPALAQRFGVLSGKTAIGQEGSLAYRFQLWKSFFPTYGAWLLVGKGFEGLYGMEAWDSGYFNTLIVGGVPAIIALFFLNVLPGIASWRRLRIIGMDHPDAWLHLGSFGIMFPILLTGLVNNTWSTSQVMSVIAMVNVLSLAAMKIEDQEYETLEASEELALEEARTEMTPN